MNNTKSSMFGMKPKDANIPGGRCKIFREDMELPTKNIRSSTEHRDHQANTQDHDG